MKLEIKYKNGDIGYYEVNQVVIDKDVEVLMFNVNNRPWYTVYTKDLKLVKLDGDTMYIDYEAYP